MVEGAVAHASLMYRKVWLQNFNTVILSSVHVCANESIQDDLMTLTYPLMSQLTALLGRNLSLPFNFISSSLLLLLYPLI